mmetsp:Transcript_13558/g.21161  ORF Transcript_13558/g.21161 Transcript_13558/m.21161 type:complete len:94 (+) Transcript_13558:1565-1846(+)
MVNKRASKGKKSLGRSKTKFRTHFNLEATDDFPRKVPIEVEKIIMTTSEDQLQSHEVLQAITGGTGVGLQTAGLNESNIEVDGQSNKHYIVTF